MLRGRGAATLICLRSGRGARTVECIDDWVRDRAQLEDGICEVGFGVTHFIDLHARVGD